MTDTRWGFGPPGEKFVQASRLTEAVAEVERYRDLVETQMQAIDVLRDEHKAEVERLQGEVATLRAFIDRGEYAHDLFPEGER